MSNTNPNELKDPTALGGPPRPPPAPPIPPMPPIPPAPPAVPRTPLRLALSAVATLVLLALGSATLVGVAGTFRHWILWGWR